MRSKNVKTLKKLKNNAHPANVYEKLKEDHRKVEKLFEKVLKTSEKNFDDREPLFNEIYQELSAHADAEEKIFYPVTEGEEKTKQLTLEAYEEHNLVKLLLEELKEMDSQSDVWMAKMKVLSEVVKHHVKEEEEELFPKAKKVIDKNLSRSMADEVEQEEEEFKKAG